MQTSLKNAKFNLEKKDKVLAAVTKERDTVTKERDALKASLQSAQQQLADVAGQAAETAEQQKSLQALAASYLDL